MCPPKCQETVLQRLRTGRRGLMKAAGMAAAGGAATMALPKAPVRAQTAGSFSRVVDLTHTMGPDFPTFGGGVNLEFEDITVFSNDGYNLKRWLLIEHTGTHMDAPFHFSEDGQSADEIPIENLVAPLAVVDISAKAEDDPDAQLTPDDLAAWEAENGPIPEGACVAMHSGWDAKVGGDGFRNADADGVMHFPGFHVEAAAMMMEERSVVGIAVDTLSLDFGPSPDFATHYLWLPSNRWGMEAVANLGQLPPVGATIVVGGPKIKGATGGPSRVIALA